MPFPNIKDKLGGENEWEHYLKKRNRQEKEYYFFTIRMIAYSLCSVFLTLFFIVKLGARMQFADYMLAGMYILGTFFVFGMIFFDVNRFNRKKGYG